MNRLWKRQLRRCLSCVGISKAPAIPTLTGSHKPLLSRLMPVLAIMSVVATNDPVPGQDAGRQAKIDQILAADHLMRYEPTSDKFFKLQLGKFNWQQAEQEARDITKHNIEGIAGRLAAIKSAEENDVVKELCTTNEWKYPWIAASDRDQEGRYQWYVDNAPVEDVAYSNWGSGHPATFSSEWDYAYFAWWGQWLTNPVHADHSYLVEWSGAEVLDGAVPEEVIEPPKALSTVTVPLPDNLDDFIKDRHKAVVLGKALFWDMQVGSDGFTACASCHFAAGIDQRTRNVVNPGAPGSAFGPQRPGSEELLQQAIAEFEGPNDEFDAAEFPHAQLEHPTRSIFDNTLVHDSKEVYGSQGVVKKDFVAVNDGNPVDTGNVVPDPVFNINGANARQVTGRNTPTTINAVFFDRLFWDGRANHFFNGVNEFGDLDPNAKIWVKTDGSTATITDKVDYLVTKVTWLARYKHFLLRWGHRTLDNWIRYFTGGPYPQTASLAQKRILLNNAALASQAVGPPLSDVEMSWHGRNFNELGRKMMTLKPLALQAVHGDDSVLGHYANVGGKGLQGHIDYPSLIRETFADQYWSSSDLTPEGFTQIEANFSLFWGLSLMMYQSTLVSDQAPYDHWANGDEAALSDAAKRGLKIFLNEGKCISCHGGPEFAGATVSDVRETEPKSLIEFMVMGDGGEAFYDGGFYNIGVRPTLEDIGVGAAHPEFGPLSYTRQRQNGRDVGQDINVNGRVAVDGAFKSSSLRNIELTGPYFHTGGYRTLREVVEFYTRGGTFIRENKDDIDPDVDGISELQENPEKIDDVVAFMKSLTDDRVRFQKAPFDHPQLLLPNGHTAESAGGVALDDVIEFPAVGRNGGQEIKAFEEIVK